MNVWRWFAALVALNLFDWYATSIEVSKAGDDVEANPAMNTVLHQHGPGMILAVKIVMLMALAYGIIKLGGKVVGSPWGGTIKILAWVFGLLAMYHIFILSKL